ncbi:MAG: hypothetical protein HZB53_03030 [Chloroflexi bacterium]|nr:hypothetical protein [Chloroflexota bacterium]
MAESLEIRFLDSHRLQMRGIIRQLVALYQSRHFRIASFNVAGQPLEWSNAPDLVTRAVEAAEETRSCYFLAHHDDLDFSIDQHVAWNSAEMGGSNRAWIVASTSSTAYFWRDEYDGEAYAREILSIGTRLYDLLRPTFGWCDFDHGEHTAFEDVETLKLPALYWANFFGHAYVEAIGRDKILSAPNWQIQPLTDGGLLYVLAPSPGLDDFDLSPESVGSHFGVPRVR